MRNEAAWGLALARFGKASGGRLDVMINNAGLARYGWFETQTSADWDLQIDVNLRGEMAFPVAERLEAEKIPFLFATGYGQAGLPERWRQRPVIQKPFGYTDLSRALEAAVSKTDR